MDLGDSCPEEILRLILGYLDDRQSQCIASLVCHRWHNLMTDVSIHVDESYQTIEVFQRGILERFDGERFNHLDQAAVGHRLHRKELSAIDQLAEYPNYVRSCDHLVLHGIDFETIAKSAQVLRSLDQRIQHLELRLFADMNLDMQFIERCFPNLRSITIRSGHDSHVKLTSPFIMASPILTDIHLIRIRPTEGFQLSPQSLEYVSDHSRYSWDLEHLNALPNFTNLTELIIGKIFFDIPSFQQILVVIRDHLPKLITLGIDEPTFTMAIGPDTINLLPDPQPNHRSTLKYLKYTNYYLESHIDDIVALFSTLLNARLEKVTLEMITRRHPSSEDLYRLIRSLYRGNCSLEMRIDDRDGEICEQWDRPPVDLADILIKLDLIGVSSTQFIGHIIGCGVYNKLTHLTLEKCRGLDRGHLQSIAQVCIHLESLQVLHCHQTGGEWLIEFLRNWNTRKSRILRIRWEPSHGATYVEGMDDLVSIIKKEAILLNGKRLEEYWKRNGSCRISIWESGGDGDGFPKAMVIRDYEFGDTKVERFSIP